MSPRCGQEALVGGELTKFRRIPHLNRNPNSMGHSPTIHTNANMTAFPNGIQNQTLNPGTRTGRMNQGTYRQVHPSEINQAGEYQNLERRTAGARRDTPSGNPTPSRRTQK